MRHARYVALALALFGGGCASLSRGLVVNEYASMNLKNTMDDIIEAEFTPAIAPRLKKIGITFQKDVALPIIGDDVAGYYNPLPLVDHITIEQEVAKRRDVVVHEMLHHIWFRDLWFWERWAFWFDLNAILADSTHYKEFVDRVHTRIEKRHWLNTLFAETTEAYSEIGEDIVNGVAVPKRLRRHYKGILKTATNQYPCPPDSFR